MYTTYHPPRRKRAILYHLLAIWSLLLPRAICQFPFPTLPPDAAIFTTQDHCREVYNECMGTQRDCLRYAGPSEPIKRTCEDWRSEKCENKIRMGCDGLPNPKQAGGGGGGTLGAGMTSSGGPCSLPTGSSTPLKSAPTSSVSFQHTQTSDSTSSTSTPAFPSSATPPIIPSTFSSSFTIVITSAITTTQTFTTGTSTWTATRTRAMTTTGRRGLNFTMISNDSTRSWCRTGIGVGFIFFWGAVGWAGCWV